MAYRTINSTRGFGVLRDTMDTTYALTAHDTPLVSPGDTVAAGDLLARGAAPATFVAYAAMLRLSADVAADEVIRHDGAACAVGRSLGARRAGLITRTVPAPVNGVAQSLPQSGALAIRDETATAEYRARYGGTVQEITEHAIVITSAVVRCGYAFANDHRDVGPLHIEPALLDREVTAATMPRTLPAMSSTAVAHLADAAHFLSVLRTFHGTLFIGSVTEPVALALLERAQMPTAHRAKDAGIVVLAGLGDRDCGMRAVAVFRHLDGAQGVRDRFTQTVTIVPPGNDMPNIQPDIVA